MIYFCRIYRKKNESLPSHYGTSSFTIAAFDNLDNTDRNNLSRTKHAHDTAITIFRVKPQNPVSKPKQSTVELKSITKFESSNVKNLSLLTKAVQNFLYQFHLTYHQIYLIL